jgi:hypothetical protein
VKKGGTLQVCEDLPCRGNNDGREVPGEWLAEAVLEVVDRFGAASYETQKVEGHWRYAGTTFRDDLVRLVVDVQTRRAFCEATGLSEDMLSHVLRGRKDVSIGTLTESLQKIGYALAIVPLPKTRVG